MVLHSAAATHCATQHQPHDSSSASTNLYAKIQKAVHQLAHSHYHHVVVALRDLKVLFSEESDDARTIFSRHFGWMTMLSSVFCRFSDIFTTREAFETLRVLLQTSGVLRIHANILMRLITLSQSPNGVLSSEANSLLDCVLRHNVDGSGYVVDYDALDALEFMVRDPVQCSRAARILSKVTRYMNTTMSVVIVRRFGKVMSDAAYVMAATLSNINTSQFMDAAEWISEFLANCLIDPGSHPIAQSLRLEDSLEALHKANEDTIKSLPIKDALKTTGLSKVHSPVSKDKGTSISMLLDGLQSSHPKIRLMYSAMLGTITMSKQIIEALEDERVLNAVVSIADSTDDCAVFRECLQATEIFISFDRRKPSRCSLLLQVMQKAVRNINEGYDSDIIECTLSGLVGPFSRHRMARETFISAGGITTYLRLLQRLQFRDLSEPLFTHTLDSLLGLLTDGQAIRESEKVGMITALTTLIQEHRRLSIDHHSRMSNIFLSLDRRAVAVTQIMQNFVKVGNAPSLLQVASLVRTCWKKKQFCSEIADSRILCILLDTVMRTKDVFIREGIFDALIEIIEMDKSEGWAKRAIPTNKSTALSKMVIDLISESKNARDLSSPMALAVSLPDLCFAAISMERLVPAVIRSLRIEGIDPATCFRALGIIMIDAKAPQGRQRILRIDPKLNFLRAILEPSSVPSTYETRSLACSLLCQFTTQDTSVIIRNQFVPFLLKSLLYPGSHRVEIASALSVWMTKGGEGSQAIHNDPSWKPTVEQLLSREDCMECAFQLLTGLPLAEQRKVWSDFDRLGRLFSYIVCSKNPQLLDTIFLRLKTLSRDQKRLQMILYQVDVMGHIQMFISQVVAVGDTGKRHWAVCCCSALSLLSALPIAEKFTPRSKNLFQTLVTLFSDTDRQLASEALRFTYRIAMQGDSEMRQAILDRSLEGLIKLHSHDNYATHAEAAESIKELASDPNILPGLIQRLAIILDKFSSGENLLSTSLLVVEDLASTPNEEAREYCMEMSRTGIPSLLIVLERYHPSTLVKSRAKQATSAVDRVCSMLLNNPQRA